MGTAGRARWWADALWCAAGAALVVQAFLPWTERGPLSSSSPLVVVRLVLDGVLGGLPAATAPLLLLGPALGAVLLASVAGRGRVAAHLRRLVAAAGCAWVAGSWWLVLGADLGVAGAGALAAMTGVGAAVLAVLAEGAASGAAKRQGERA